MFGRGASRTEDGVGISLPPVGRRLDELSGKKVGVSARPEQPTNWKVDNLMENARELIPNKLAPYLGEIETSKIGKDATAQALHAELTAARKKSIEGAIIQAVRAELTAALRGLPSRHTIGKEQFSADDMMIIKSITGKVLSSLSHDRGVKIPSEILDKYPRL